MLAQALLVSLIPLLPVRAAVDAEDPGTPPHPTRQEAPPEKADPPVVESDRRNAVYLTLGFGTPLGGVGIEFVHRLGSVFEIAGGLGIGEAASSNLQPGAGIGEVLQWAVMPPPPRRWSGRVHGWRRRLRRQLR